MAVTRQVQVISDDLDDLTQALTWVIKYHDREFELCPAFSIQIEKNQHCPNPMPEPAEWVPFYKATISGVFEYDDEDEGDEDDDNEDVNSGADVEKEQ